MAILKAKCYFHTENQLKKKKCCVLNCHSRSVSILPQYVTHTSHSHIPHEAINRTLKFQNPLIHKLFRRG